MINVLAAGVWCVHAHAHAHAHARGEKISHSRLRVKQRGIIVADLVPAPTTCRCEAWVIDISALVLSNLSVRSCTRPRKRGTEASPGAFQPQDHGRMLVPAA